MSEHTTTAPRERAGDTLTPEQRAAVDAFVREMQEEVIPSIVETIHRRHAAAWATRDKIIGALADSVVKATEYGTQDGGFVRSYILPTGPIHRAIPLLSELGIEVRPGFDGRLAAPPVVSPPRDADGVSEAAKHLRAVLGQIDSALSILNDDYDDYDELQGARIDAVRWLESPIVDNARAALRAPRETTTEDTARLDWLEQRAADPHWCGDRTFATRAGIDGMRARRETTTECKECGGRGGWQTDENDGSTVGVSCEFCAGTGKIAPASEGATPTSDTTTERFRLLTQIDDLKSENAELQDRLARAEQAAREAERKHDMIEHVAASLIVLLQVPHDSDPPTRIAELLKAARERDEARASFVKMRKWAGLAPETWEGQ